MALSPVAYTVVSSAILWHTGAVWVWKAAIVWLISPTICSCLTCITCVPSHSSTTLKDSTAMRIHQELQLVIIGDHGDAAVGFL